VGESFFDGKGFIEQARAGLTMSKITPLRLQLKTLWDPFRSKRNILIGIFPLKLFDVIPLPVIFSTRQFNQIFGKIDIIALTSIQFSPHSPLPPINLGNHCFRDTGDFRRIPFSLKILKQSPVTFYHISLSKGRKEEGNLSPIGKKAEEVLKATHLGLIALLPDEEVGKGKF
jgi:hypothetical protein